YFVVWDELKTEKPSTFTFLLNADREIKLGGSFADLINADATLRVFRVAPEKAKSEVVGQMVQARGLPGSVDKGDMEKRGVQFRETTDGQSSAADFIHVLFPFKTSEPNSMPTVSLAGKELKITFPNGDSSTVCLGGGCKNVAAGDGRIVVQSNIKGKAPLTWQRRASTATNSH
ncbi:MAG TPA: hypothetical protein VGQ55_15635, partial [Pyrinomonadaceae bacterium]|nr:hypothetical protein [Pyrinomonadaceae bacterium]